MYTAALAAIITQISNAQSPLANGTYQLVNRSSNLSLVDAGYATGNGYSIGQWTYDGGGDAQWKITQLANGNYSILNVFSGLALVDAGYKQGDGYSIAQWAYDGGTDAQWKFISLGSGSFELVNEASNLALVDAGYKQGDGYSIGQWTYDGGTDAQWQLNAVTPGGGGGGSFNELLPESIFESAPSVSNGNICSSIAGSWNVSTSPTSSWILTQTAEQVTGSVSVSDPQCGTVTWQVSGSLANSGTGEFTLNSTNPQPASCENQPFPSLTDTVTLSAPQCTTGTGIHTSPDGNFDTTWTDPAPPPNPVPTKLNGTLGNKSTYTGGTVTGCAGTVLGYGYGYSRCMTYQVVDQSGKPIQNASQYEAKEAFTPVSSTYKANQNVANAPVNDDGRFFDFLALTNSAGPIPANSKGVLKQTITIVNTSTNATYTVRVNCVVKQATDVSVYDVTTSGDQTCKSY